MDNGPSPTDSLGNSAGLSAMGALAYNLAEALKEPRLTDDHIRHWLAANTVKVNPPPTTGSGVQITSPLFAHTWALGGPRGMLVQINLDDGSHKFGEAYEPDEAAKVFWQAVTRNFPLSK